MKKNTSVRTLRHPLRRCLSGSIAALLGATAILGVESADAAPVKAPAIYWLGNTNGNWSQQNWASDGTGTPTANLPVSNSDVNFSASGAAHQATTLDADFSISSLTINDSTPVSISGSHTLTLTGSGASTGITINNTSGGFSMSANLALTAGSNTIVNNSGNTVFFSGNISGATDFVVDGGNTINVSGANTYTGATRILNATLQLGADNTLPTGTTVIINTSTGNGGSTLDLNGHNQTVAGLTFVAPDDGFSVVELNGGRLVLKGNIQVIDGTEDPGNGVGAVIQDSSGNQTGVLDLGGAVRTITVAGQNIDLDELVINVPITNGGVIINAIPSTFNGTAAGVKFNAVNNYTGGTTIAQGTLTVEVDGALPTGTDVIFGTANSSIGGTLDLAGTNQTVNSLNSAPGNSAGPNNIITSTFSDGGDGGQGGVPEIAAFFEGPQATLTVDAETVDSTFSGLITSNVTLIKIGPRTLTLTGANDFVGNVGIGGGTLQIVSDNNLGDPGNTVYLYNNGTLRILASITTDRNLVLDPVPDERIVTFTALSTITPANPGGTIDTNGFTLEWDGNISGSGQLTKVGLGTLILTDPTNSYLGGTAINGGVLAISADGALGDPSGGLSFGNGGTLQFLGAVTSARTITLNAGGGAVDTNGFDGSLTGNISGIGGLSKLGLGTLTLTGNNNYMGPTNISGGTLQAGSTTALSSNSSFVVGGGATLDLAGFTSTIGSLAGAGTVTSSVGGAVSLTAGGNGASTVFSGVMQNGSGAVTFTKTGTGTLDLTGANTYTGNTTVAGGKLLVDGSTASANTFVQPGAILGGHGVVGGFVSNNGTVSPGNSPGTLTVTGAYTQQPTGTLLIEVGGLALPQHDLLAIGGVAKLTGALNLVRLNNFNFHVGEKVTFLTANSGVIGTFSSANNPFVTDTLVGVDVVYQPNAVLLEGFQLPFRSIPHETPNQFAVATALDDSINDPRNAKMIRHLDGETLDKVLADLDRIAPDELTSIYQIAVSQGKVQNNNLERRLEDVRSGSTGFSAAGFAMNGSSTGYSGPLGSSGFAAGPDGKADKTILTPAPENRWGAYVTGTGEWASVGDTYNARAYDLINAGFTVGLDYKVTDHFALGVAMGYDHSTADLVSGGRVTVDGGKLSLYGTYFTGKGFYVNGSVGGGYNGYDTHRAALKGFADGSTEGGEFNAMFGTGYDIKAGNVTFGPVATFEYNYVGLSNFGERGSLAPLDFPNQHQESIRTNVGMKATCDWKLGSVLIKPEIRATWQHEYSDATFGFESRFASGAGPEFLVHGPATGRDSLMLSGGFAVQLSERVSTYVYYDGELARQNYHESSVSGGFRFDF